MATAKKAVSPAPRRPTTTQLKDSAAVVERTRGDRISLTSSPSTDGEKVTVIIPKPFILTRDDGAVIHYESGVQEMLVDDAAHWFARAQGVKVYAPKE